MSLPVILGHHKDTILTDDRRVQEWRRALAQSVVVQICSPRPDADAVRVHTTAAQYSLSTRAESQRAVGTSFETLEAQARENGEGLVGMMSRPEQRQIHGAAMPRICTVCMFSDMGVLLVRTAWTDAEPQRYCIHTERRYGILLKLPRVIFLVSRQLSSRHGMAQHANIPRHRDRADERIALYCKASRSRGSGEGLSRWIAEANYCLYHAPSPPRPP
ncbi:uncharacterized protein MYCFIDRAFT_177307 [Pseudocercospora fijiensis CIRAD86]|uniref:Uncharacterized protein n=1 Tax=Pseudocercospora fijiensis (strain CIRAD86) TaxID=383855 RepID=M3AT99_PSEFD|nr:uncharacterized protein MYCFIDRAFT_177307 [Pseudocercospora fijiensis CIRAD86]EME80358.1 hypothetical protein MYCFIDRAFT_177307 [Pseudocercospora fijiensis CIRAD86]